MPPSLAREAELMKISLYVAGATFSPTASAVMELPPVPRSVEGDLAHDRRAG
jgi:hypothetical protein